MRQKKQVFLNNLRSVSKSESREIENNIMATLLDMYSNRAISGNCYVFSYQALQHSAVPIRKIFIFITVGDQISSPAVTLALLCTRNNGIKVIYCTAVTYKLLTSELYSVDSSMALLVH